MINATESKKIAAALTIVARNNPSRFRVRASGTGSFFSANGADQNLPGITCPQQTGKTANCGTCTLCWDSLLNINFIGHGRSLKLDNNAIVNSTTVFQKTIKDVESAKNTLKVSSNDKLGKKVVKGPWKNSTFLTLTLTERETCPVSCLHWNDCYGNGMRFAHRMDVVGLMEAIERELSELNPEKFYTIRLHVLGDFFSPEYVEFWGRMLDTFPNIRIFGYTAHAINNDHLKKG